MAEFNKPEYDREFNEETYGETIDSLNTVLSGLLLGQNMNGQIIEDIELPDDGSELRISHNLKSVPKYRIILRQNGAILDGETAWTDKYIYLKKGAGEFVKDLALRQPTGNLVAIPEPTFPCNVGEYRADDGFGDFYILESDCLNTAMGINANQKTKITILLMRG